MGVRKNTTKYFHRYVGWQVEAAPWRIHCEDTKSGLRHVGKTIEIRKFKRVKNESKRRTSGIETKRESVRFLSRHVTCRMSLKLQDNINTEIRL